MLKRLKQNKINHNIDTVLSQYRSQHISIPLDIIEELDFQKETFSSIEEITSFIENLRNNWKLENQKKFKPPTN